ncbi:MAG: hypothetical protein ACTTHG_04870 [Treponemataceae bacterium]
MKFKNIINFKNAIVFTSMFCFLWIFCLCSCQKRNSDTQTKKNIENERSTNFSFNDDSEESIEDFSPAEFFIINLDENTFALNDSVKTIIADYVSNWSGELKKYTYESSFFTDLKIVSATSKVNFADLTEPVLYVFSPEFQGICQFGFCDKNANKCRYEGYFAIFDEDGTLLNVSNDNYTADQDFELQLSTDKIYYIVLGRFFQNETQTEVCFFIKENIKGGFNE